LHCAACSIDFLSVNGIPWLFQNPDLAWADWRQRIQFQFQTMLNEISLAEVETKATTIQAKKRLNSWRQGLQHNLHVLGDLLKAFAPPGKVEFSYQAVKSELPLQQQLMGYYANIHRDWCWGANESRENLDFAKSLAGSGHKWGRVLVLGSGAGRLSYDLATVPGVGQVVALDINPLLMLFGQAMTQGKVIQYFEFPIAPKNSDVAIEGRCAAPNGPLLENKLCFVLGDGLNPPFKPGSFDTVITPWFIDVIPMEFGALTELINSLLASSGAWLNLGPYGFLSAPVSKRYSTEELGAIVSAAGFNGWTPQFKVVPYLQSPFSGQSREENILGFKTTKVRSSQPPRPFQLQPSWLLDWSVPVPKLDSLAAYAQAVDVQESILSKVDGKTSIATIALQITKKYGLTAEAAGSAVATLLRRTIENPGA
jgi:SAM-dependent methyltransferase